MKFFRGFISVGFLIAIIHFLLIVPNHPLSQQKTDIVFDISVIVIGLYYSERWGWLGEKR